MPPNWHLVAITLLSTAIAGLVWLIRLEAKVTYLDKTVSAHLDEKGKLMDQLNAHFSRLEHKVDKIALRCAAFHSQVGYIPPRLDDDNGDGEAQ